MARAIKGARGGTLYALEKGETANPNGRPRKWVSTLKEQGYKLSEINDCLMVLASMTEEELKKVRDDESLTIMERTTAKALINGLVKGSIYNQETLITRIYGKPKETSDVNVNAQITAVQPRVIDTTIPIAKSESDVAE